MMDAATGGPIPAAAQQKPAADGELIVHWTELKKSVLQERTVATPEGKKTEAVRHPVLNIGPFGIRRGEFLCILGKTGVGKSTLLGILGLFDRDFDGVLSFEVNGKPELFRGGEDDEAAKARYVALRQQVGYVFQRARLQDRITGLDNAQRALICKGVGTRRERREIAQKLLASLYLPEQLWRQRASAYSGGEQQRVSLARALAACPRLLVCDEPTGSVDRETADDIFRQLRAYNETMGITVVVVTHDEGLAWTHAHRVVRLESNGEGATLVPAEPRRVQNQEDEEKHKREDGLDEIDGAPADGKAKEGSKPLLGTPRIPELAPSPARTRLYDWLHGVKGEFLPAARTRARLANVLSFIFCPFMAMAAAYMMLGMTLGVEQVVGEINRGLDSVRRVTVYASEAAHAVGVLPGIEEVEAVPHVRDVVGRWDLLGDLLSREDRNDFRRGGFLWPRAEASERYSVTISALAGDDPQWREWGFESPFSGDDAPEAVIHIGSAERLGLSREDFPDAGQKLPKHRRIRLAIPPVGGYERRWSEEERADVDFGGLCLDLKVVAGAPGITPSVAQVVVPAALLRRIIDWRERDRRPEDFPASLSCLGISAADAAAAGTQSRPDPSPAPTVAEMVAAYPPSLYHVYVDELQNVGAVHTAIAEMHKSKDPPIQYDVESNRDAVQTTQGFFTYAAWGLRFLRYMPIFFALVLIFFATLVMVYRRRSDLVLDVVLGAEPLAVHRRYGWVGLVAAGAGAGLGWLGGALAIRGVNLPIQRFLGLDLFLAPGFDKALWLCFAPTVIMSGLIAYFAASYALRPNLADIIRD